MQYELTKGLTGYVVKYQCPQCQANLRSPLKQAGTNDDCPDCQAMFVVPGTDELAKLERKKQQAKDAQSQKREHAKQQKESARKQRTQQRVEARSLKQKQAAEREQAIAEHQAQLITRGDLEQATKAILERLDDGIKIRKPIDLGVQLGVGFIVLNILLAIIIGSGMLLLGIIGVAF